MTPSALAGDQKDLRTIRGDDVNAQVVRPRVINVDQYVDVPDVPGEIGNVDRRRYAVGSARIDRDDLKVRELALHRESPTVRAERGTGTVGQDSSCHRVEY